LRGGVFAIGFALIRRLLLFLVDLVKRKVKTGQVPGTPDRGQNPQKAMRQRKMRRQTYSVSREELNREADKARERVSEYSSEKQEELLSHAKGAKAGATKVCSA
jgi:hypothetical protein